MCGRDQILRVGSQIKCQCKFSDNLDRGERTNRRLWLNSAKPDYTKLHFAQR